MSSQTDQTLGNLGGSNAGMETLGSEVKGATLHTDKSSKASGNPAETKDDGKTYIGSLPDNSGMGATGVRDITTPEEEDARTALLGGDGDVVDSEP